MYDSFSGIVNYPATSKGSDFVYSCLRHFVGLRFKNPDTVCRSGAAPELVKAIRGLGWLPETALPRRWPHDSKCERMIRTFEECCRRLHLQAGFAVLPKLWPIICTYAAVAISIDKWESFWDGIQGRNLRTWSIGVFSDQISVQTKVGSECITSSHGWMEVGIWTQVQRCFDFLGLSSLA